MAKQQGGLLGLGLLVALALGGRKEGEPPPPSTRFLSFQGEFGFTEGGETPFAEAPSMDPSTPQSFEIDSAPFVGEVEAAPLQIQSEPTFIGLTEEQVASGIPFTLIGGVPVATGGTVDIGGGEFTSATPATESALLAESQELSGFFGATPATESFALAAEENGTPAPSNGVTTASAAQIEAEGLEGPQTGM